MILRRVYYDGFVGVLLCNIECFFDIVVIHLQSAIKRVSNPFRHLKTFSRSADFTVETFHLVVVTAFLPARRVCLMWFVFLPKIFLDGLMSEVENVPLSHTLQIIF